MSKCTVMSKCTYQTLIKLENTINIYKNEPKDILTIHVVMNKFNTMGQNICIFNGPLDFGVIIVL